jgi:hypothetical protein
MPSRHLYQSLRNLRFSILALLLVFPGAAQWIKLPTVGIPRTKDGKPNLSAPAPKKADGKPDFSGIWEVPTGDYLANLATDGIEVPMQPWAAALFKERQESNGIGRPSEHCLPHSVTDFDAHFTPRKLIQLPDEIVLLFEQYHSFREIFTDSRSLPDVQQPAWFGYSVGHWEGDTLVVNTIGVSEETWLDDAGHPHTEEMRIVERFRRPDFGHMEVELTINDPKAYTKPWTVKLPWRLVPDTELLDGVCQNEKDFQHLVGK